MDKQKEIEEMAKAIKDKELVVEDQITASGFDGFWVDYDLTAERFINAGYGDVKQAVRDFAEKVKNTLDDIFFNREEMWALMNIQDEIDELVKEVCGE